MGTFTVPGDGDIDFDPIFKVLEESGYTGYMVVEAEQDPAKANPLEYALKARKFISEKTGLQKKNTICRQNHPGKIPGDFPKG